MRTFVFQHNFFSQETSFGSFDKGRPFFQHKKRCLSGSTRFRKSAVAARKVWGGPGAERVGTRFFCLRPERRWSSGY